MLTYTVDFLSRNIIEGTPGGMRDSNLSPNSLGQIFSATRLDRSMGSPDSLRSESSFECSVSTSDLIFAVEQKAAIVTNGSKTDKPAHSYIALISMAILSSKENKMALGDIYQFIMKKFQFYNNEIKAWRNSIRHNLSINECFIKNGRSDNGKGNFWSIHPACVEDFSKGDFRRRQARRRARKGGKNTTMNYPYIISPSNSVYTPMTSSPMGYQSMTPTSLYQHMASSLVGLQPMTSSNVSNFPFLPTVPGNRSTPYVSQGYHPYKKATTTRGCYAQARPDYQRSTTSRYPSAIQMSPVERLPFTSPSLMNTNGEIYSNWQLNA